MSVRPWADAPPDGERALWSLPAGGEQSAHRLTYLTSGTGRTWSRPWCATATCLVVRANHDRAARWRRRLLALVLPLLMVAALPIAPASARPPDVQWNQGSGPAQMGNGLPNPPGWYRAAVGRRTGDKVLYLTLDDGPSSFTRELLKALGRNDSAVTFFVVGRQTAADPHALR